MKAIALISGGLDSILAARIIQDQGLDVIPVNFRIPFCHNDKEEIITGGKVPKLVKDVLGKDLQIIDISEDFIRMMEDPVYGFGSNMNPCIDCKILMLKEAAELMKVLGAEFVVTGEVLGQRPMSQHRNALDLIARRSGLEGLLIRPLSAKLLDETIPEKSGWLNRQKMLDLGGRGRSPQFELAAELGIKEFPWPSGGCLLTDPEFSRRLRDLVEHNEMNINNCLLLKIGRHFRLSQETRLVVGRNEKENIELERMAGVNDYLFYPDDNLAGPTSLGRGIFDEGLIQLSASITCRYCDINNDSSAGIIYRKIPEKDARIADVYPAKEEQLELFRIGGVKK